MNNNSKKNRYKREEGVTIIDLVIAIIIMSVFVGVITSLMTGIYKQSLEVQISSNAMSYATIILEKIDEKSFEEVQYALTKYKVALQKQKQTEIWLTLCNTFTELFDGDIRNLFDSLNKTC